MTTQEALTLLEREVEDIYDRELHAAITTLTAALDERDTLLEQHRELESIVTDLVKWFADPPDCPLFDLVNRARAYAGKEQRT